MSHLVFEPAQINVVTYQFNGHINGCSFANDIQ